MVVDVPARRRPHVRLEMSRVRASRNLIAGRLIVEIVAYPRPPNPHVEFRSEPLGSAPGGPENAVEAGERRAIEEAGVIAFLVPPRQFRPNADMLGKEHAGAQTCKKSSHGRGFIEVPVTEGVDLSAVGTVVSAAESHVRGYLLRTNHLGRHPQPYYGERNWMDDRPQIVPPLSYLTFAATGPMASCGISLIVMPPNPMRR